MCPSSLEYVIINLELLQNIDSGTLGLRRRGDSVLFDHIKHHVSTYYIALSISLEFTSNFTVPTTSSAAGSKNSSSRKPTSPSSTCSFSSTPRMHLQAHRSTLEATTLSAPSSSVLLRSKATSSSRRHVASSSRTGRATRTPGLTVSLLPIVPCCAGTDFRGISEQAPEVDICPGLGESSRLQ